MNGTSVMTGLACLAWDRADRVARLATRLTACNVWASAGNAHHFDEKLFALKPHAGPQLTARRLRGDLLSARPARNDQRLQDRYSLRCAPHVIGVLEDAMPWLRQQIENELNSANDNPIDRPDERACAARRAFLRRPHRAGHGHAEERGRQRGRPAGPPAGAAGRRPLQRTACRPTCRRPPGQRAAINHGLKALQISVSAWTAEALKQTMPASVFSRSTECHNQDKVSMGTIAARDALRVLELTEQVVAALLIAASARRWPCACP
jgi:histidine ammonia-lyase